MIKTRSASNLLDANTSPAIGADGACRQSLPPLTTEKRSHAEIGDGSPQSPTEKRNCLENMEQKPPEFEYFPPTGKYLDDEKRYPKVNGRFVGEDFYEMPAYVQEGYLKVRERYGPLWEKYRMYAQREPDSDDDEPFGNISDLETDEGYGIKDYPNFKPLLKFRENSELYDELRGLAEEEVAYFNDKNKNQKLCFEDIERVALCQSCCHHYLLTVKAIDLEPLDATSVMFLRGEVVYHGNGRNVVHNCEVVTLDAC